MKNQYVSGVPSNKNTVTVGALAGLVSSLLLVGSSCKPADPVTNPAPGEKTEAKPAATVPAKAVKHAHTNRLA